MTSKFALFAALTLAASSAMAQDRSIEIYGAYTSPDTLNWHDDDYDTDAGYGAGAGIYWRNAALEYGADLMYSERYYTDYEDYVAATSLMGVVRYHFALGPRVDAYAGLGLGMIDVRYDGTDESEPSGRDLVGGGQVSLGVNVPLASGAVFGEVKYQATFDTPMITDEVVEYQGTFAVIGYKFSF